jgi:hypothetical protein
VTKTKQHKSSWLTSHFSSHRNSSFWSGKPWQRWCTGWFCVSTWHKLGYHRERSLPWGNASMGSSCKAFSQLVIKGGRAHCEWCHLWAGSLGFYKRAGWARQGKQASKEHPSMASASAPASWPAWVPVLTSFGDEQQYGSVSWINPFLPNLLLDYDVCAGIETLTKTTSYISLCNNGIKTWELLHAFW